MQTAQEPAAAEGGTFYNDERPVSGQDLVWGWRWCIARSLGARCSCMLDPCSFHTGCS